MRRFRISTAFTLALAIFLAHGARQAQAFHTPERLVFELKWGMLKVGRSEMRLDAFGPDMLRITTTTKSYDWLDSIYPVNDLSESYIDRDTLYSERYVLDTHEGSRDKDRDVVFLRGQGKAVYIDHLNSVVRDYEIPPRIFDPQAAFYYSRTVPMTIGTSTFFPVFDSKKNFMLEVKIIARERIRVPAGTFDTVKIMPLMQSEGMFSSSGSIYIWVTDDEHRVPVKIRTNVLIGSVIAYLIDGEFNHD